jgi:hypothetical protein
MHKKIKKERLGLFWILRGIHKNSPDALFLQKENVFLGRKDSISVRV